MGTSVIKPGGGGNYTSLITWEAAKDGDLSAMGVETASCEEVALLTEADQIDINGWTNADATHYVKITVAAGYRHNGVPGAGFRVTNSAGNYVFVNRVAYTRLEYLEAYGGDNGGYYADVGGATNVRVAYCIAGASSGDNYGFYSVAAGSITYFNDIAYDCGHGFYLQAAGTWTLYNCTTADCTNVGYRVNNAGGTMTLVNCIGYNSTNYDFLKTAGTMTTSYCLSKDATADDNGALGAQVSKTLTFNNAAANDFRLAATDTDAIGNGLDDPGTGLFSDDIDGTARVDWDIGADEYATAATASYIPHIMFQYRQRRN